MLSDISTSEKQHLEIFVEVNYPGAVIAIWKNPATAMHEWLATSSTDHSDEITDEATQRKTAEVSAEMALASLLGVDVDELELCLIRARGTE